MNILAELILKYGSDKNLSEYTQIYEPLFRNKRNKVTTLLEVGIGTLQPEIPSSFVGNPGHFPYYKPGGSLRAWRDYFTNAQIYGMDVAEDCRFEEERIKTFIVSSTNSQLCNNELKDLQFDIIIDDGLHTGLGQLQTMKNLFHRVKEGGYYVIEDCGGGGDGTNIFVDFNESFRELADQHEYFFRGNIMVVRKNYNNKAQIHSFEEFSGGLPMSLVPREEIVYTPVEKIIETSNISLLDKDKSDLTIVTGLWNIGRDGRSFDHYLQHFNNFLDIDANLFLYVPKELEDLVWAKRSKENTFVKIYELEDIKRLYNPFWNKTQEIRTSENWLNITGEHGWLKNSPQAALEWYNPIVQSKMFLLNDVTIWNPFNTEHFIWLDAGITNTVYEKYFTDNKALDKILPHLSPFLFLSYPYESAGEIHGFDFKAMNRYAGQKVEYVCRGGLFGGKKEVINQASGLYYTLLERSLSEGYMGTEESIFSLMSYVEPEKYRRYALDGNGLVVKFVQALLDDKVKLEPISNGRVYTAPKNLDTSKLKTSLYILTFNFPEQLRHTLKTYEDHPEWLNKTRKILIDNSNNDEAISGNKAICEEYGFEHIITGENLGINRGRLYAAKHFQESDSDYYIFLEDDMGIYSPKEGYCRNGFKTYEINLFDKIHKIMLKEEYDFLKLSFTEVFMDNNIQCSWYNVPQHVRTEIWPNYSKLPVTGLDLNCPRTKFNKIDNIDGLSYIDGEVYYCNWPMIVSKKGNQKMFLDTDWAHPYEQTWMSHMFQETIKENLKPAVLLASPINHNRIVYYEAHERREN
jgi:hypothetical protein